MVRELLDEPGVTLRSLAAATYDKESGGEVLNKDFWSRVARGVQPKLTPVQLRWMAVAMRLRPEIVQVAAAEQYFGLEPVHLSGYDDDTRRIIISAVAMPPGERRKLRVWVETPAEDGSPN